MLQIPVYDAQGKATGSVEIDPAVLGGRVRARLLKQAVVMYQANARQNTSATRSRGMVIGSTRKLYRQKGTGNARMGTRRTNIRRGGGVAFAKGAQDYSQGMNKKMRRLARNNAVLAKVECADVMIVEGLGFDRPSTKRFAAVLQAVGADRGALVATGEPDRGMFLSGRNIPKVDIRAIGDVNAYDVLRRSKVILTRSAFEALAAGSKSAGSADDRGSE